MMWKVPQPTNGSLDVSIDPRRLLERKEGLITEYKVER
jgi:hypothetical protein